MYQGPRYYDPGPTDNFGPYDTNGYMARQEYPGQGRGNDFYESSAKLSDVESKNHRIARIKIEKNDRKLDEWESQLGRLFETVYEREVHMSEEITKKLKKKELASPEKCEFILNNVDIEIDTYESLLSIERLYSSGTISTKISPVTSEMKDDPRKRFNQNLSDVTLLLSDVLNSEPFVIASDLGNFTGENVVVVRVKGTGIISLSREDIETLRQKTNETDHEYLLWKIDLKIAELKKLYSRESRFDW